eukprot:CAMPEP_0180695348 /NCGR_PEP_ID=MMETSP1038_2-20121128/2397_1 /TAXON_ID=632150 /ORGANISM="Azadinium spinosum, Strain 3D9" /LENGTH=575 /DNA_ID=CAMNT_0022726753 /DNA_START=11 /DNA_END=1736 /DNA_ORIENTATION=+
MKFNVAPLRRELGAAVEWLFPAAPVPWAPRDLPDLIPDMAAKEYFAPRSPFEERITDGQPFTDWFKIHLDDQWLWYPDPDSKEENALQLYSSILHEEAVAAICFTQGAILLQWLAALYLRDGREVPWRCIILVTPTLEFLGQLAHAGLSLVDLGAPVFLVSSSLDSSVESGHLRAHFESFCKEVHEVTHDDPPGFPTTDPRAKEVYATLAEELRRKCGLAARELPEARQRLRPRSGEGEPPRWAQAFAAAARRGAATSAALSSAQPFSGRGRHLQHRSRRGGLLAEPSSASDTDEGSELEPGDFPAVPPPAVAELLLAGAHVVRAEAGQRAIPGCLPGEDVSALALRMRPQRTQGPLRRLRESSGRIVVVSETGEGCTEYCALLAGDFDFPAERLCWLEGGLRAWAAWELDHEIAAGKLRAAHGLPALIGSAAKALSPEELAALLRGGGCLALDVREPTESKAGLCPPRGVTSVSSHCGGDPRQEARQKLARLLEDGRPVVAISGTGCRCRLYCDALVAAFGVAADRVHRLEGGLQRWESWAAEHQEEVAGICAAYDLPLSRERRAAASKGLAAR